MIRSDYCFLAYFILVFSYFCILSWSFVRCQIMVVKKTSKNLSENLSNQNKLFWMGVCTYFWWYDIGILIHVLSWNKTVCYDYWDFLMNFLMCFLTPLFDAVQNSSFCHFSCMIFFSVFLFLLARLALQDKQKITY